MNTYNTKWRASSNQWIRDTIAWKKQEYRRDIDFLKLATIFDLKSYVSDTIYSLPDSARRTHELATLLLRFLLPSEGYHIIEWGLPLPSTEMVCLLLAKGADPNACDPSPFVRRPLSAWESTFLYILRVAMSDICASTSTSSRQSQISKPALESPDTLSSYLKKHDTDGLPLRYLRIMQLLVKSGADLSVNALGTGEFVETRVFECMENIDFNAVNVAERVLLKTFPTEAAHLLCELRGVLTPPNPPKPTSGCKRSREQVEENGGEKEEQLKRRSCISSAKN
jgi:hypothetical protein